VYGEAFVESDILLFNEALHSRLLRVRRPADRLRTKVRLPPDERPQFAWLHYRGRQPAALVSSIAFRTGHKASALFASGTRWPRFPYEYAAAGKIVLDQICSVCSVLAFPKI
jgi:hypothetical protein